MKAECNDDKALKYEFDFVKGELAFLKNQFAVLQQGILYKCSIRGWKIYCCDVQAKWTGGTRVYAPQRLAQYCR